MDMCAHHLFMYVPLKINHDNFHMVEKLVPFLLHFLGITSFSNSICALMSEKYYKY